MADWLPGWTRHLFNLRGKPYQFTHNPKGCLHTTEGGSIAGALAAYAPYPPHGIYNWRTREKLQHVPLSLASYSAMDGNDDDYMVQIELVGFAAESRFWPDEAWRNIAEDVLKPLEDHFGVPRRALDFKDARDGITPYISSAQSPIRITPTQLRDYSGWLGHQHLCAPDDHWDPGAIQIVKAFAYMDPKEDEDDMPMLVKGNKSNEVFVVSSTADGFWKRHIGSSELNVLKACGAELKVLNQWDVDQIKLRSATGEAVWNYQIPSGVPNDYADAHKVVDAINRNTMPEEGA